MKNIFRKLIVLAPALLLPAISFASEGGSEGGYGPIGAALAIGMAALGGTLGQGKALSAGLEGIARNPQANIFIPMVVGLALIESLVILSWLIANSLS